MPASDTTILSSTPSPVLEEKSSQEKIAVSTAPSSSAAGSLKFSTTASPEHTSPELPENNRKTQNLTKYKPSSADMKEYYENFLPFSSIVRWLNHSTAITKDFTMREFAFEHKSGAYQRYKSYANVNEFKNDVVKSGPTRFEIGAVFPVEPAKRREVPKSLMKPQVKEFVLDIDLTDYDDIRTCCTKTEICNKCWKFINIAIEIVDYSLRNDFNFKHLIWVFSGRRGVHCWVSDYRARTLNETTRRSIVEYLDVLNIKSKNKKTTSLNFRKPYHPLIERSFEILKTQFIEVVIREQDPWKLDDRYEDLARSVPDYRLTQALLKYWKTTTGRSSADKWVDVDTFYHDLRINSFDLQDWKREMIFKTMYPRLDVEVSKQIGHLLKSPFCVHPGTGNVCIPFDPSVKPFDPLEAPNLQSLFNQDEHDVSKTSLQGPIDLFDTFVRELIKDELSTKRQREEYNETSDV